MIFIGEYKELGENTEVSMKDYFENKPFKGKDIIIQYLMGGKSKIASTGIPTDVFTNERIPIEDVIVTDGKYYWGRILAYYVEKYNLRLPKEFEDYILNKDNQN